MNFLSVVINVRDLSRSIDFYREVLGFTVLSQEEQLAAVSAPRSDLPQVIVLREIGSSPIGGARHVGLRAFLLEVDSVEELERIESDLNTRRLFVTRRSHPDWIAVVGLDPDEVAVVVTCDPRGERITQEGWKTLDDFLYEIGE